MILKTRKQVTSSNYEERDLLTSCAGLELQNLIRERQDSLQTLFNEPGLRQRPYDLRAVLHTDGLSGTGHYWGYIWVDAIEVNLLADIPSPGGWYRFCDAKVEKVVDEEDVWRDIDPFALVYTDRSAPTFSKQQLDEITPADLMVKSCQNRVPENRLTAISFFFWGGGSNSYKWIMLLLLMKSKMS